MDQNEPPKPWEKPWTPDDLRQNSTCWSLAGDAGLLRYLQEFSQNLLAKTHATQKSLDELVEDLNTTSSAVNNVTNSFLSLANTQFVENRVDDDDEETKVAAETTFPFQKTPSKAEIEVETVDMVREALTVGMSIMDTMFETVEVPAVSDSEEDESSASMGRVLLRPVNPYANRPLPFLIGSREFYEDDRVGLADVFSDEEESGVPGATEIPSSESASDVEADYAISDRIKRRRIPSVSGSENSEPESEQLPTSHHSKQQRVAPPTSNMFGEENSHEAADEQPPAGVGRLPNNFAAELAARLGVVPETEKQTAPQKAPLTQEQQKDVGKMFLPPLEDDDDDDNEDDVLFGKNAKYSAGGGLFDDLGDWNKKSSEPESLWDEPENNKNQTNKQSDLKPTVKEEQEPTFGQNKADDLFGNDLEEDLFSTKVSPKVNKPSVASMPTGGQKSVPVVNPQNVKTKVDKSAPPLSETSGLFDDLWDASDFDYNSTSNTVQSTAVQSTARKEDSLFVPADEKVVKDSITNESIVQVQSVKKPVGGVSVLGNMNVTASQLISRLPSSIKESGNNDTIVRKITENEPKPSHITHPRERSDSPVNPPSLSKVIQQKKPQSLFDDDNDSDEDNLLFSSASSTGSRSRRSIDVLSSEKKIESSSEEPPQKASLFGSGSNLLVPPPDDANDDLFSVKTSGLILGAGDAKNSSASRENIPTGGLFDDWEDDILSTESKKENSSAPALIPVEPSDSKGITKEINHISKNDNQSKLSSLFDKESGNTAIFSGDVNDNFVISSNASENDIFSETGKTSATQRQNSKVNLFSGDDFDEEVDIFGEKLGSDVLEAPVINKVTSLRNKTDPGHVMTTEPPIFPDEPASNVFSVPVEGILSKDTSMVKDTSETRKTENTEVAAVTPTNIYDAKKPAVTKKPVVSLHKPPAATQPVGKDVEARVAEISIPSSTCVDQLSPDVNGMHNIKKQAEIDKEPVDSEIHPKESEKKEEVIAPVTKPKPPKTLDIRKTTTLQQDSSTGEDTFGESPPGMDEEPFHISQKTEHLSSTAFGELLKGYSPPEDKTDGSAFSREKQLNATKRERADEAVTSSKSGEKLPGRIQRPSLNIDPLALLPGAKPPRKGFQSEEGIGFDQPAADITAPLHSAGKERVKIQVKRRPQSRQARQEALRASTTISQDETGEEAVPSPAPRIQQPDRTDDRAPSTEPKSKNLEAEQNDGSMKVPTPNPPATGSSLLSPSTDEEDLFGVPSDLPSDYSDGNDLFRAAPMLSPTEVPQLSQKAGFPVEPAVSNFSQSASGPVASLFTSSSVDREESFSPAATPHSAPGKQSLTENQDAHSEIVQSTVTDPAESNLFQVIGAEISSNSLFPDVQKEIATEKDLGKSMKINKLDDLFSNVEEDLFPSARSDNYSSATQTDLFGNNSVQIPSSDGGLFSSSLWTSETQENVSSTVKFTENIKKGHSGTDLSRESDSNSYPQSDHMMISSEKISCDKSMDSVPKIASGGLSVLNDDENDRLFSTNSKTDARTSHKHSNTKEKNIKIRTGENSTLFGDDSPETDDLFSSMPHSVEKRTVSSKTAVSVTESKGGSTKQALSKGSKSLFDDDEEEDLFGRSTAKPNVSSSSRVLSSVDPLGKDELFSTRSVVPNKTQRTAAEASSGKKKETTVVFDDPLMAFSKSGDTSP